MSTGFEQIFQGRYTTYKVKVEKKGQEDEFLITINEKTVNAKLMGDREKKSRNVLFLDGKAFTVEVEESTASSVKLKVNGKVVSLLKGDRKSSPPLRHVRSDPNVIHAQIPGKILSVLVKPGSIVSKGEPIIIMESMKMETRVRADRDGKVKDVKVKEGKAVSPGDPLIIFE